MGNGRLTGAALLALLLVPGMAAAQADAGDEAANQTAPTAANSYQDPSREIAEVMPLAANSLLLDFAETDQRAIAVGERGTILVSESRTDWRQLEGVPTRSTLTAVTAFGNQAWAVGHEQVILHSADGGLTWVRQHDAPFSDDNVDDPRNGAPLLDVLFLDADKGFAVGAYGLMLRTDDAGANWIPVPITATTEAAEAASDLAAADAANDDSADDDSWTFSDDDLELDQESNPHLNGIVRTGSGGLFIAAERGSAFRSRDGGDTWERIHLPYDGSMFGAIGYGDDRVLAFGLRGHVFQSDDLGDSWEEIDTGTELSLQGGAALNGSGAVLVGSNGLLLWRTSSSSEFQSTGLPDVGTLASVLPVAGSGQLVIAGENGISSHVTH